MKLSKVVLAAVVLAVLGGAVVVAKVTEPPGSRMTVAAQKFLDSLPERLQAKATFEFDDPERIDWHFIPRQRKGAALKVMTSAQKELAKDLLRTGTSPKGYQTALAVMALEGILGKIEEGTGTRRFPRDPTLYFFSIFGEPTKKGKWGWRVEGHHLCVNYVVENGRVSAMTPIFYGSNPAIVPSGSQKGMEVLAAEEDLARELYTSLKGKARKKATLAAKAPRDILSGTQNSRPKELPLEGLTYAQMNEQQKELLDRLLKIYTGRYPTQIGRQLLGEVKEAGIDGVYFGWAGPAEPGQGHYYRIQGPTFLVEFANTQNGANHIHSLWRDARADLGF